MPLNLFGGAGSITEEQLAYVMPRALINRGTNEQRLAEFVLSGPGGGCWEGRAVGAGRGLPARSRQPGAGSVARAGIITVRFVNAADVPSGAYDVREVFAEVQLPLLHDRRWARDMALNIGLRWSDFSSFDQNTSWQAGLRWQLAEELTLRANYAEVFRAPTIVELYEPARSEDYFEFDPCGNDPTPTQQANCAANGVPGGAYVQGDEGFTVPLWRQPRTRAGDGAQLRSRRDLHAGLGQGAFCEHRLFPGGARRLHLAGVSLRSAVRVRGARHQKPCEAIRRFPDGRVSQLATFTENFGGLEVRGVDFAIDWSAMTRLGDVSSSLLATYLDRWDDAAVSRR